MRTIEIIRRGRKGQDGLSKITQVDVVESDVSLSNDDSGKAFRCTTNATVTIPSTVASGWSCIIDADGGDVTVASAATINGQPSVTVSDGNAAMIYSTGTAHFIRYFVATDLTALNATAVGFTPITGNSATNVSAAIGNLTALWNAVSTYGKTLIAAADAAAARTVLGLSSAATLTVRDQDDMAADDANSLATQQSIKAYVDTSISLGSDSEVSTSGTAVTISTAIPADINWIEVMFSSVSLDGANDLLIQVGGGSFVTSGYTSTSTLANGAALAQANSTAGFIIQSAGSGGNVIGRMRLTRATLSGTRWFADHTVRHSTTATSFGSGEINLGATLQRIQAVPSGANNFDAGAIYVRWGK